MSKPDHAARYVTLRRRRSEFARERSVTLEADLKTCNDQLAFQKLLLSSHLETPTMDRTQILAKTKDLQETKERLVIAQRQLSRLVLERKPTRAQLHEEFRAIRTTPTVYTARVFGNVLRVEIAARLKVAGARYNLGDWAFNIDLFSDEFSTDQIRSGLHRSVAENSEFLGSQYFWAGFCFGDNLSLLTDLVNRGDYVTAVRAAVTYMNDVNPEHWEFIDRNYRKVRHRA